MIVFCQQTREALGMKDETYSNPRRRPALRKEAEQATETDRIRVASQGEKE